MIPSFKTLIDSSEFSFKEKGSVFTSRAYPQSSIEKGIAQLDRLKKEFYYASHLCYAIRLVGGTEKYSDAGEPSGTAGIRIIQAIEHFKLYEVMVVVIRYFGGTKLGVGPLGKAYYDCAYEALYSAKVVEKHAYISLSIKLTYDQTSLAYRLFSLYPVKIIQTTFDTLSEFKILINAQKKDEFIRDIINDSKGKIKVIEEKKGIQYL